MIFEPIVPLWAVIALVALGVGLAYFQYGRGAFFGVKAGHRLALLALKTLLFLFFAFLLLNPHWVREVKTERPARIAVLFDVSESMNSLEAPDQPTAFAKLRDAYFRQVHPILEDRAELRFYTFSSKLSTADQSEIREMENTGGAATNIRGAIQETLSQQGSSRPAAILMLTDGNHNWGPDPTPDILQPSDSDKPVPLIAVSTEAYGEIKKSIAIPQVTLPSPVFSDEETEVRFQVVASGASGQEAKVRLSLTQEEEEGEWAPVADEDRETTLPLLSASSQGAFPVRFPEGGKYRITVSADAEGIGSASSVEEVFVEPGRWRVAYYVGRPGWMNAGLVRRLAPAPRYALRAAIDRGKSWSYLSTGRVEEESEEPGGVRRSFLSLEEVAYEADLIILEGLSGDQFAQLPADLIRDRLEKGAALLFIAGKSQPPTQNDLVKFGLDVRLPVSLASASLAPTKRQAALTETAATNPVTNSPTVLGIESFLPLLEFPYLGVRPTNEAQTPILGNDGTPVLATLVREGQRTAFIGVNDLWRWQFQPGEKGERIQQAYGAFMDRLLRWLILGEEEDQSLPNIMISQSRIPLGKTVEVGVQYTRAISEASATVRLMVTSPDQQASPLPLARKPGGFFTAEFTASDPGEFTFHAADPERPSASDTAKIEVEPFSIETAVSGSRVDLLRDLAEGSGGIHLDLEAIGEVTRTDRVEGMYEPRILTRTISEPVMASPWVFLIAILLFCSEWTLRRLRDLP